MDQYLSVSIALIVFMGLVSGGMLSLVLMTTRRYLVSFSIILGLALLLALGGVFASVAYLESLTEGLANALVLLILASALGYTLTTFSVLSYPNRARYTSTVRPDPNRTAVILLAPGEPPDFGVRSASRRLALADDAQDVPAVLLRPFHVRDLRSKYAALGTSPFREYHTELVRKVQSRLDANHRVYSAFYNDTPSLSQTLIEALDYGAGRIVIVHTRAFDPPDPVLAGDLFGGLNVDDYGVQLAQIGPLHDADLLPQMYVRRALEAVPQVALHPEEVGILLVGRGHPTEPNSPASIKRQSQEEAFQKKVRYSLARVGFDETRVAYAWLRWQRPNVAEALGALVRAGCKAVLWLPSTFLADGVTTLEDIPSLLNKAAAPSGVRLIPLGAWNADDLAAEEIATRVRALSTTSTVNPTPARA